jgi:Rrf2 family protein
MNISGYWLVLSRKSKYGLKAALFPARENERSAVPISDIARSKNFLRMLPEFIMVTLKNNGILYSQKGRGGGCFPGRFPADITVAEIIRVFDGPIAPVPCVSVTAYHTCNMCPDDKKCEIKLVMKYVCNSIANILDFTGLTDLIERTAQAPS